MGSGNLNSDTQEKKSKSQNKREAAALHDLGRKLIGLPESGLYQLPLDKDIVQAVLDAKNFKREAQRRQLQHLAKLLRGVDADSVFNAMESLSRPHKEEIQVMHEIEQWRDRLIGGDNELLDEVVTRYTRADRQYLRQLVRNAILERDHNKPPKSARALYRYLFDLHAEIG